MSKTDDNMYMQFFAKRDNNGQLVLNNKTTRKGSPKVKVQGEKVGPRLLTASQSKLLQDDLTHPFFYVKLTPEEVAKLRKGGKPKRGVAKEDDDTEGEDK